MTKVICNERIMNGALTGGRVYSPRVSADAYEPRARQGAPRE